MVLTALNYKQQSHHDCLCKPLEMDMSRMLKHPSGESQHDDLYRGDRKVSAGKICCIMFHVWPHMFAARSGQDYLTC